MSFISYAFVVFFLLCIVARVTIGRRSNAPVFLRYLLASSLVFYGWHRPEYLAIVFASAGLDYVAAQLLVQPGRSKVSRRWILAASMSLNLGLLGFFKYANFALGTAGDLSEWAGYGRAWVPLVHVTLPIGISFYTFQSMSYTIDVYRGHLTPARTFWRFLLCVTFFPHLVAGPIVRARDLLHQLDRPRRLRSVVMAHGTWLIVRGLFLKMVIADNIGTYLSGTGGATGGAWEAGYVVGADAGLLWLAVVLFAVQIYCDFAGYTDIARGLAYLVGIRLPLNFHYPYIARSFSDFWRRWHISLSRWLRDYLYVPLGGNRVSPARIYVNLLTVMVLGGLWHGAAWTFVIWGTIHGLALAVERAVGLNDLGTPRGRSVPAVLRAAWGVVVLFTVLIAWVFFRSDSFAHAAVFMRNLFTGPIHLPEAAAGPVLLMLLLIIPVAVMHLGQLAGETLRLPPAGAYVRAAWAGAMLYAILSWYGRSNDFIYFQF